MQCLHTSGSTVTIATRLATNQQATGCVRLRVCAPVLHRNQIQSRWICRDLSCNYPLSQQRETEMRKCILIFCCHQCPWPLSIALCVRTRIPQVRLLACGCNYTFISSGDTELLWHRTAGSLNVHSLHSLSTSSPTGAPKIV